MKTVSVNFKTREAKHAHYRGRVTLMVGAVCCDFCDKKYVTVYKRYMVTPREIFVDDFAIRIGMSMIFNMEDYKTVGFRKREHNYLHVEYDHLPIGPSWITSPTLNPSAI